jgi:predicted ATPase
MTMGRLVGRVNLSGKAESDAEGSPILIPAGKVPEATYEITGFRSLQDFKIGLTRGLNVLVGPNGSGKTNFIEFLDFLSAVLSQSASTAVSRVGGVSRAFSTEQNKNATPRIRAFITGTADLSAYTDGESLTVFDFDYEIEIRFSKSQSTIFIAHEMVRFRKLRTIDEHYVAGMAVGALTVRRQASSLSKRPRIEIGPRLLSDNNRNPMRPRGRFYFTPPSKKDADDFTQFFVAPDESLLSARTGRPAIDAVRAAIMRGRSFNLIPDRVRAPDDITRSPSIMHDGSGLTSTLFHLQRTTQSVRRARPMPMPRLRPEQLEGIVDWTRLVFPELRGVHVIADPHTGKYLGNLVIGDAGLRVPLQSASDGTLKWLALVTLIITRGGAYSIEEPENFLHPKMQQFLVDLIRDYAADSDKPGYFIMSTHSETIINRCEPEELVLFNFKDGKTVCSRLKNADAVKEEINLTGFGLGYYYANNAVS